MEEYEVPASVLRAMRDAEPVLRSAAPYIELAQRAAPYLEQARRAAEITNSVTPAIQYAQLYAEERRQVLEVARSMAPIVAYVQRHAEQAQQALAAAEQLFAYVDQFALATGPALTRFSGPGARPAEPRHHAASASLVVTPTLTAHAEVVKAADSDVDTRTDALPDSPRPIDYGALAIKLFWAYALVLPLVVLNLSAEVQQTLILYLATISLALIINWRYNDTHKR